MKRLIFAILAALLLFCSCEKEIKDGGYSFSDIYVIENGVKIDAQGYKFRIPSDGGEYDLVFQTHGLLGKRILNDCGGITVDVPNDWEDRYPPSNVIMYKEKVHVTAGKNNRKKSRKFKFRLLTEGGNGHAADITIMQLGN